MSALEVELALAELGAGQWGLFTTPQARAAGVSRVVLSRLAQAGVLVRETHGVYVLKGAGTSDHLQLRAAWLALDPTRPASERLNDGPHGAVVSHASAAKLYGFGELQADRHEFTTPDRKQSRRPEVRLHRGVRRETEITVLEGLPVTKPERIILDLLASGHDGEHVAGVLAAAVRADAIDTDELALTLDAHAARFGLPSGDGRALLSHLFELGGIADRVAADELVQLVRSNKGAFAQWGGASFGAGLAGDLAAGSQIPGIVQAMKLQGLNLNARLAAIVKVPSITDMIESQLITNNIAAIVASSSMAELLKIQEQELRKRMRAAVSDGADTP